MDPNACLRRWWLAVLSEDESEANEAYAALREWLARGGFEPAWGNGLPSRKQFEQYDVRTGAV